MIDQQLKKLILGLNSPEPNRQMKILLKRKIKQEKSSTPFLIIFSKYFLNITAIAKLCLCQDQDD